jgi:hypothetical protein
MAKRKVNLGGQEFMAEEVEFQADSPEAWSSYALHDGTRLKLKVVLADVLRVDNQYAANGDPLYTVNATIVASTNAPEHLRKKE